MKIKTKLYKTYGTQQKQFSDVSFSNKGLPQENRKVSNKQPYLPFKGILKRTNKAKNQQKEGHNKDQRRVK